MRKFDSQRGIAVLEAAVSFVVILTLLMSGLALTDFFRQVGIADELVDRYIFDDAVRPYSFSTSGGTFQLVANTTAITDYLDKATAKAKLELEAFLQNTSAGDYYLEMRSVELAINQSTGAPEGIVSLGGASYDYTFGGLSVPGEILQETDLDTRFDALAQMTSADGVSTFAVPTALYGLSGSQARFLPRAVMIGLRVVWSIEESFTGNIYEQVGGLPYVYDAKVTVVRGEIEA
ncbi:MAG: hypothetical protein KDD55_09620 [Bdellovibrionales bacterium]|nr:hypothetical protein [Bdellovibrionales bacterium]